MSTENPVAERLLTDARKKTAKQDSPTLAKIALGLAILALVLSPIVTFGYHVSWFIGGAAVIAGGIATQRSVGKKLAWTATALGFLAICVATFLYTLVLSR